MNKAELEARRLEYEQSIRFVGWDEDCIFSAMNGYDFAAALLQGEMDAEKERYELALASSIRYGNKVFDLESQLRSANAKLAVMRDALTSISAKDYPDQIHETYWLGKSLPQCAEVLANDTQIAREALAAINGKEDMA